MASEQDRRREAQQAQDYANHHRRRAGELYVAHRQNGDDHTLSQAKREAEQADSWQRKAEALQTSQRREPDLSKQKPSKTRKAPAVQPKALGRSEAEEAQASTWGSRRAWFLPGTVADDKILQAEEAQQSGMLDQLGKYAARNVFDRQFRTFEGAKQVGKAVAAPAKAVTRGGQAVMDAVRHHAQSRTGGPSRQNSALDQVRKPTKQQPERTQQQRKARGKTPQR